MIADEDIKIQEYNFECKLIRFLHQQGYNMFNINALTIPEINVLIEGHNLEQKEKERQYNTNKIKNKRRR